jgi:hypothetical protein
MLQQRLPVAVAAGAAAHYAAPDLRGPGLRGAARWLPGGECLRAAHDGMFVAERGWTAN